MAELDLETTERAVRWCAEAGRQTTAAEVRGALASLGWDQLLQARALLAGDPPARPLGPHALADLARGVPADVAAERERDGRYPRPGPAAPPIPAPAPAPVTPVALKKRAGRSTRREVVVRKASPAMAEVPPTPPRLPLIEELLLPAGRGELSRLIRRHGGRRPLLVSAIASTHRRADGASIGDADLDGALEHHGLERSFMRRERDELFHAVRAASGVLATAATALGHDLATLGAAITRLGLDADVKRLREARRRVLLAKATLSERALLWVGSGDALTDLELLEEVERDLARRLPEHLRALATTGEPLELGLVRTLALPVATVKQLLTRLGIDLRAPIAPAAPAAPGKTAPGKTAGERARGTRQHAARPAGSRPAGRPPAGAPPATGKPVRSRPGGADRSGPPAPGGRPYAARPTGRRPSDARPSGGRTSDRRAGARPVGPRPSGGRPSGGRASGPRPSGGRPSGARRPSPGTGRRGPR